VRTHVVVSDEVLPKPIIQCIGTQTQSDRFAQR